MFGGVYTAWSDWLYRARKDDRGYSYLIEPSTGTLALVNGWYDTVKQMTIKSTDIVPSTKTEVRIISDIDEKIVRDLGEKINSVDKQILYPEDWAAITNHIGKIMLYVFYRAGANAYRYDIIVGHKRLKNVVGQDVVPYLDACIQTWDGSFPRPGVIYRMAYLCADISQPEEERIFTRIKPSNADRKIFGPKQVREMILQTPEKGIRELIFEKNAYPEIRSALIERRERKLCPAALLKIHVPKEKVVSYRDKMMSLYPRLYGTTVV